MTQLPAGVGSDLLAPSPPSSAAAVGMETSTPRAGNQLAPTTVRSSVSYRGELQRASSRDKLSEMAASSQGKDGRARRRRRGQPPSWAAEGEELRASLSRLRPPGSPSGAGVGSAPGARPWSGRSPLVRPPPGSGQGQAPGWGRTAQWCCLLLGSLSLPAPPSTPAA